MPSGPRPPTSDYIRDIADAFCAKETVTADDAPSAARRCERPGRHPPVRVAYLRHEQDLDLQAFGLKFDSYFLESSVYQRRPA